MAAHRDEAGAQWTPVIALALLAAALVAVVVAWGWSDWFGPAREVERDFAKFMKALASGDGKTAAELVTRSTL